MPAARIPEQKTAPQTAGVREADEVVWDRRWLNRSLPGKRQPLEHQPGVQREEEVGDEQSADVGESILQDFYLHAADQGGQGEGGG